VHRLVRFVAAFVGGAAGSTRRTVGLEKSEKSEKSEKGENRTSPLMLYESTPPSSTRS
jgi:hypothetical protein